MAMRRLIGHHAGATTGWLTLAIGLAGAPSAVAGEDRGLTVGLNAGMTGNPAISEDGPSVGITIHAAAPDTLARPFAGLPGSPRLRIEGSLSRAHRDGDSLTLATLGPMLRWKLGEATYLELSSRPGYVSSDMLGDQDLGGHFQFSSRLGLGREFAVRWRLGLSIEHTSNAGLYDANEGFNLGMLRLERNF